MSQCNAAITGVFGREESICVKPQGHDGEHCSIRFDQRSERTHAMSTESHTPIIVPCEDLDLVLRALASVTVDQKTAEAVERVRGRFPANWNPCEFEHPHPTHPCGRIA